jgi:hypothetical protein
VVGTTVRLSGEGVNPNPDSQGLAVVWYVPTQGLCLVVVVIVVVVVVVVVFFCQQKEEEDRRLLVIAQYLKYLNSQSWVALVTPQRGTHTFRMTNPLGALRCKAVKPL